MSKEKSEGLTTDFQTLIIDYDYYLNFVINYFNDITF